MEMAKWRKKPVVIHASQWNGHTLAEARQFQDARNLPHWAIGGRNGKTGMIIPTLEGDHLAESGDYIICGVQGEFYPCKPDIFAATYEAVLEDTPKEDMFSQSEITKTCA